jgi:hypothetical protein
MTTFCPFYEDITVSRPSPKALYRKTVREDVDDDILTKQYFPRAHKEQYLVIKRGSLLIAAVANRSLVAGRERGQ